ncbi:MAG: hypothetical protein WDW38_004323 [Sanguina aurantia]
MNGSETCESWTATNGSETCESWTATNGSETCESWTATNGSETCESWTATNGSETCESWTATHGGGPARQCRPCVGPPIRMEDESLQGPCPSCQHELTCGRSARTGSICGCIEAVENHMPEVIIVDEIGTVEEALACRTIAERGIQLIGTAHGRVLENLIKNVTLSDLIGGIQTVTLGDEEARNRGTRKTVLERRGPPTFPIVVEIRDRAFYVAHFTQDSVDALLSGKVPNVQVRERSSATQELRIVEMPYDKIVDPAAESHDSPGTSSYDQDFPTG